MLASLSEGKNVVHQALLRMHQALDARGEDRSTDALVAS